MRSLKIKLAYDGTEYCGWQIQPNGPSIQETIEGPLSARCPASILQFHQKATVIIDEEASQQLELTDYYKRVREEQEALLARFGD